MQAIGLALTADDHLGGVLGDDGVTELIQVEVGTEQNDLVSHVAHPPGGVTCEIGVEPTHHDTSSGHVLSVTPWGESPHTMALRGLNSPHVQGLHFDVTRESLRLDEFLHSTRRFPA